MKQGTVITRYNSDGQPRSAKFNGSRPMKTRVLKSTKLRMKRINK